MSCNYPGDWPPQIHTWKNGTTELDSSVIVAFGRLRKSRLDDEVDVASKGAAREWIGTEDRSLRQTRLQQLVELYGLELSPGLTRIQVAERFLAS